MKHNNSDKEHDFMKDDALLHDFFGKQKHELLDNGFSEKVMKHIPDASTRFMFVWNTLCAIGIIAIFYLLDIIANVTQLLLIATNKLSELNFSFVPAEFHFDYSEISILYNYDILIGYSIVLWIGVICILRYAKV